MAVLNVIAYHAFPESFKSGFVGVDIFFVISGFLITNILLQKLSDGSFSFLDFYKRRAKRIFPALIVMLIAVVSFGWWALLDNEYKQLGKHTFSTAAFISNIIFWREAGYFDIQAELKPLLHMWSLGIEEQFYLVWPLILWFTWIKKINFKKMFTILIGASFLYSIILVKSDSTAAFYSPISRLWELALGGWLAYAQTIKGFQIATSEKWRNRISAMGLIFVILGFFIINKERSFPGWRVLLPVVGTALIISSGSLSFLNRYLLSSKILVGIGLISYPLYLWHWPLLSYARILVGETPNTQIRLVIILISVFLSWLTYVGIEKPIRFGRKDKILLYLLYSMMFLLGLCGWCVYKNSGFNQRFIVQRLDNINSLEPIILQQYPKTTCEQDPRIHPDLKMVCSQFNSRNPSRPTIVLWGDSSSSAWSPVFLQVAYEYDFNVVLFSHASCPPLVGTKKTFFAFPEVRKYCESLDLGQNIVASIQKISPIAIYYIGAWNNYSPKVNSPAFKSSIAKEYITESASGEAVEISTKIALKNKLPLTIQKLEKIAKTIVFRPWPTLLKAPNYHVHRIDFLQSNTVRQLVKLEEHVQESQFINEIFDSLSLNNTIFIDPSIIVCNSECEYVVSRRKMYIDSYHVSPQGTLLLKDEILKSLK